MKVIKIGSETCPECKIMKPRWAEIEKENPWLQTEYVDFENQKEEAKRYLGQTETLPTFIFLDKNSNEFLRLTGKPKKEDLVKIINENKFK